MSPLTEQILKSKRERRQTLARLSFPEKVRIVERLRSAATHIAAVSQGAGLKGNRIHLMPAASAANIPSHPAKKDT
jgi:galactokinase